MLEMKVGDIMTKLPKFLFLSFVIHPICAYIYPLYSDNAQETSFICNNATNKSLILIDELGRATSNEDGVAIAWSISEFLLVKRAMTFFVTHYTQLSKLAEVYPNVQNQHLSSTTTGEDIKYTHKIMPGPCKVASDYGVEMAQVCGWPMDVVNEVSLSASFLYDFIFDGKHQDWLSKKLSEMNKCVIPNHFCMF